MATTGGSSNGNKTNKMSINMFKNLSSKSQHLSPPLSSSQSKDFNLNSLLDAMEKSIETQQNNTYESMLLIQQYADIKNAKDAEHSSKEHEVQVYLEERDEKERENINLRNQLERDNLELFEMRERLINIETAFRLRESEWQSKVESLDAEIVSLITDRESLIATLKYHENSSRVKDLEIGYLNKLLEDHGIEVPDREGSVTIDSLSYFPHSVTADTEVINGKTKAVPVSPEPITNKLPAPHPHPLNNSLTSSQMNSTPIIKSPSRDTTPGNKNQKLNQSSSSKSNSPVKRRKVQGNTSQRRGSYFGLYPNGAQVVETEVDDKVLTVTIDLGGGQSHDIHIRKGQDLLALSNEFCEEKNLERSLVPALHKYLSEELLKIS